MNIQNTQHQDLNQSNIEPEKTKISIGANAKADPNVSIDTDKDM